jgi:two-component system, NtrC family, sensor kinase
MAILDDAATELRQIVTALQRELDRRTAERDEALAQQAATGEVLNAISRSPTDIQPVFDAIVGRAAALCQAEFSAVARLEDGLLHLVALHSMSPEERAAFHSLFPRPLARNFVMGLAFLDAQPVHFEDVLTWQDYDARTIEVLQSVAQYRSFLAVPIFREGRPIGVIGCGRREVKPFTATQIALVKTFADQATIAIENVRLFNELATRNRDLGEALEQQTATAEVLQVINSSPGDLAPVFDAMLDKATHLCEASYGMLYRYDGKVFHAVALHAVPTAFADFLREPIRADSRNALGRLVGGERLVHMPDLREDAAYVSGEPLRKATVELGGARAYLGVPLRKDGVLLGAIGAYRQEVRPFSDKQITLLENFAAQAVIAMENARLLTETREALEQQTATSEVLQVINSSPGDLAPVFDAMIENALRLCGGSFGELRTYDGDRFRLAATHGVPTAYVEHYARDDSGVYGPGTGPARILAGERVVHIADLIATEPYQRGDPDRVALVDLGGARAYLLVPLLKDGAVLGYIMIYRMEVGSFTDKQIALLQNFAAQAVIAIENARLITETREALKQQTATAEVLQVINSSPGDLTPVFDAILEKAHSLCGIAQGSLELYDGERFRAVAVRGLSDAFADMLREGSPASDNPATRPLIDGSRFTHIRDLAETDYSITRSAVELDAARTLLCVPLRRDDALLGMIASGRREVRPFSDKEIALLQNFAAQAVIAIENARLLNELRDRTDEVMRRETELRVTFDNMADGVVMFDGDLRLAAWNRNFQRLLDLPDALLAERPSYADYIRHLADRGEFGTDDIEAELSRRLEDTDQELRLERTRPDGRVIEVRRNAVPGGGLVLIYGDITERKQAEARLRAARDTAEAALRELKAAQANLIHAEKMASLGQLTAGIAHEIKNPLNFVNNFAGLSVELLDELKEAAAPAVASLGNDMRAEIGEIVGMLTGNLEKIAEHGRRADGIVKSMLAHSRGGSGEWQAVDINSLVDESLNLAYHGARAQDQNFNITLERDLDRSVAPIELVPQDVTRVFLNLFGNGFYAANRRYSEAKDAKFKPSLRVTTRDLGSEVEIRVRDNGAGIPPEIRDKLFQPFFTTKPTGEGTGLGLSISYDIVTQQHGGRITVDSRVGEFTEFTIRLPRNRQAITAGKTA